VNCKIISAIISYADKSYVHHAEEILENIQNIIYRNNKNLISIYNKNL